MSIEPRPLILPFAGVSPAFASPPSTSGAGASVLGRVTVGADLVLGPFAVIRADGETVSIGAGFCLGEGSTVHIAHGLFATVIGDRVAVGRNAVVHACTVADDCAIEDDVVILDASVVGAGVLIEAGSTIYPRSTLEPGGRYAGSPAVRIGSISLEECRERVASIRAEAAVAAARQIRTEGRWGDDGRGAHFVADTAVVRGDLVLAPGAGVFFGCRFDAAAVTVGRNTNIQDNSVVTAPEGVVTIGDDTTIGHNVRMSACRVGSRSLVGIGAVLGEGTVVEDDVLVAAGTVTTYGQVLRSGWLWGSRPAKPLKPLDDARRSMLSETIGHYVAYGHAFRDAQRSLAARREGAG